MRVKGAFDHVRRNGLMQKMDALGTDGDLITWTGSFLSERMVSLVVKGHQCQTVEMEMGVSQGLNVSPILFIVYLSRIFQKMG